MELIIDEGEAAVLESALRQYVSNMSLEIGKTENYEWRQSLKGDQATLDRIIARLEQAVDDEEAPSDAPVRAIEATLRE